MEAEVGSSQGAMCGRDPVIWCASLSRETRQPCSLGWSPVHRYLALASLALLLYRVLNSELLRLMTPPAPEPSSTQGRKIPFKTGTDATAPPPAPGMGQAYLYRPVDLGTSSSSSADSAEIGLKAQSTMPILGAAAARRPLLTSMDVRMNGRGPWAIEEEEKVDVGAAALGGGKEDGELGEKAKDGKGEPGGARLRA